MWEENRVGWGLYTAYGTQSRTGPGGFSGFDYPAIFGCADRFGQAISNEDFASLRLIENWLLERQGDRNRQALEESRRNRR